METIYRTSAGRRQILARYEARLARLPLRAESRTVETCAGPTHVLLAGAETSPPLVLLHGSSGCALDLAEPLGVLAGSHRCVFVDVPGEPNRSSEVRPSKSDDSLGRWMADLLDGIGLARAAMLGVSGGGYMVLRCGAVIPERLTRAVLIVPQGLATSPALTFLRDVAWPLLRVRLSPSAANVRRFVGALTAPGEPSEAALEHLGHVLRHVRVSADRPPLLRAEELAGLEAPVLVVAGRRDVLFPGDRVALRAREVLPNLREVLVLPEANHSSAEIVSGPALERVVAFLAEEV